MERRIKILSLLCLIFLSSLVFYLSITIKEENFPSITKIQLTGDSYLSKEQYLEFARLNNINNISNLNVSIIRDRIEKHPYIKSAKVMFIEKGIVEITLIEKKIAASLISDSKQYLVTDVFEVLPVFPNIKNSNFPVIIDPAKPYEIKNFKLISKNSCVKTAFKIIKSLELSNPTLYEALSEINLRSGNDITLNFANISFPIVIGRNNEIKKIVYFCRLWNIISKENTSIPLNYIDLRYAEHIYLGLTNGIEEKGDGV